MVGGEFPAVEIILVVRQRVARQSDRFSTGVVDLNDVRQIPIFVLKEFGLVALLISHSDGHDLRDGELAWRRGEQEDEEKGGGEEGSETHGDGVEVSLLTHKLNDLSQ